MSHTLAEAFQYASQFIRLTPLSFTTGPAGGRTGDPALSIGDWVKQTILAPPFTWRWNRETLDITTVNTVQDYITSPSTGVVLTCPNPTAVVIASKILTLSSVGFGGTASFGDVVNFAGFTHASLLFLNGTTGTVISSSTTVLVVAYDHANVGSVNEVGAAATATVNAAPLFGWLEKATVRTATTSKELEIALLLGEDVTTNLPTKIAAQSEDSSGNLVFRLLPVPGAAYTLSLTFQQAPVSFSAITDTWDPIPDYMFHIYSTGVLAKAYEYLGDERWPFTMNLFLRQLVSFHGGLTESQVNIFMNGRTLTQIGQQDAALRTQQRVGSRGLQ